MVLLEVDHLDGLPRGEDDAADVLVWSAGSGVDVGGL